jgi:hypothetical protein
MLPVCVVLTTEVVMGKVAVVAPAGMVRVAGTEAAEMVEARFTTVLLGAAILSVTVPVAVAVAITVEGLIVTEAGARGCTVMECWRARLLTVTVKSTLVCVPTGCVEMVKVPVVEPAGMVMEAGAEAMRGVALLMETVVAKGTASSSVTVAVALCPPTTVVGLMLQEAGPTARTAT